MFWPNLSPPPWLVPGVGRPPTIDEIVAAIMDRKLASDAIALARLSVKVS